MDKQGPAVVLLSGGLDSATTLAIAKDMGYDCYCLSFNYGQRHDRELESAKTLVEKMEAKGHLILDMDMSLIGGSALTDKDIAVPMGRCENTMSSEIPVTYVPARNIIFLSNALAWAEVLGAKAIFIGANAVDYSGYPDCRPEFFKAFMEMSCKGTKCGVEGEPVRILTPIIDMTKAQIIQKGLELGVPYEDTWSCYKGGGKACGQCDSCQLRLKGFREAGSEDPLEYV